MAMETAFERHLLEIGEDALGAIPAGLAPDVYVVSFWVSHVRQDPRYPCLTIGCNTESQVRAVLEAREGGLYPTPAEARWNFPYWLEESYGVAGHDLDDPVGAALHLDHVKGLGLWFDGDRLEGDRTQLAATEVTERLLLADFLDACAGLARHLHRSGRIERALGRPVPVVPWDMDYLDDPAQAVEVAAAANPDELITEYLAWVRTGVDEEG
jgi:hypothetical protein